MKLIPKKLSELKVDPNNARRHSLQNVEAITRSLLQFGQRRAAVIRADGTIVAGNGMYEAAMAAGFQTLHCHVVPDDWSDEQAQAFAIADNRTAELADWDEQQLIDSLSAFSSDDLLAAAGYTEQDFADLMRNYTGKAEGETDPSAEWVGMPDFDNPNAQAVYKTVVHFMTHEDADAFFQMVDRPRSKYIYWPDPDQAKGNDSRRVGEWKLAQ